MTNRTATFRFKLYVAGDAENSARALANLKEICKVWLADRHTIEIVDVFNEPEHALANRIFMTPTLVKLEPGPVRTVVGTLSDADTVLTALGLRALAA